MRRILCILLWLFSFGSAFGTTFTVPNDQPTIQAAIDVAKSGDSISVAPGVYYETLDFSGKGLVITSQQGADSTHLRAPGGNPVSSIVLMDNITGEPAVLIGFRIDSVTHDGGAVRIENSQNCRIEQCRFEANTGVDSVAALMILQSTSCEARDNIFEGNSGAGGGAVIMRQSTALITGNSFLGNIQTIGDGAAISAAQIPTTVQIEFNFFIDNSGADLIALTDNLNSTIANNTFVDNAVTRIIHGDTVAIIGNIFADSGAVAIDSGAIESCNCFYRTIAPTTLDSTSFIGNPLFCDVYNGDYAIANTSPCAPDSSPCGTLIGALDPACDVYAGPVWHVTPAGNDSTGVGSEVSPFATIQRGIDAAADGDTVLVHDGVYSGRGNLDLTFDGKALVLMSLNGPSTTTIYFRMWDGEYWGNLCMEFTALDDSDLIVDGFTFADTNIYAAREGEAMHFMGGSPVIRNCVITDIRAGSPVVCDSASPHFVNCTFEANVAGNSAKKSAGDDQRNTYLRASAVTLLNGSQARFTDCDFRENIADVASAVVVCIDASPTFVGCNFENNHGYYSSAGVVMCTDSAAPQFSACTFSGNICEGIYERPYFAGVVLARNASAVFDTCVFDNNSVFAYSASKSSGVALADSAASFNFTNCTFALNQGTVPYAASTMYATRGSVINVTQSVVAYGTGYVALSDTTATTFDIACTDIYGNDAGNWTGPLASLADTNNNFELNPLFCDTAAGEFTLRDVSPCAPANNACSTLIGAFDTACVNIAPAITSVDSVTVSENDTLIYVTAVDDPDGPDTVVTFSDTPSWCAVAGDTLRGTPPEGATDTSFTVVVSDGFASDTLAVAVTVIPVNDPPIFTPPPGYAVDEGTLLEFVVTATDTDSDTTRIFVPDPPEGALFVDSLNGVGSFSWQPTYAQAGLYHVMFVAQDDSLASDSIVVDITVNQVNLAPVLDSIPDQTVLENSHLEFLVTAADFDNDSIVLVADSLPVNAMFVDSGNGSGLLTFDPAENQAGDYTVWIVAGDSVLADSQAVAITVRDINPSIESVSVDSLSPNQHVVNDTPVIAWSYLDPLDARTQVEFRIAVGTDTDTTVQEMWGPVTFATGDTSVVYDGEPLVDGVTYYLFLEVDNGYALSPVYLDSFRLNSVPSVPEPLSPSADTGTGANPTLWVANSTDAENDAILYDFELWLDTLGVPVDTLRASVVTATADSTGWTVPSALDEDRHYVWRARAGDSYELSDWSAPAAFYVNAVNSAPTSPTALSLSGDTCAVIDSIPTLAWTASSDPDPFDTVRYLLEIGRTAQLDSADRYDSLTATAFTVPVALVQGARYWWRVTAFDRAGDSAQSTLTDFHIWLPGDVSNDQATNISDVTTLVAYVFQGGPEPCLYVSDVDGSCAINIADLTYLIDFIFSGGPTPLLCEGEVALEQPAAARPERRR